MQRQFRQLIRLVVLAIALSIPTACGNWVMTSAVPNYPVSLSIHTESSYYVGFVPENIYDYMIVDYQGYHYNKMVIPCKATETYGYAGVVIFIDGIGPYSSYDMCCPHCLKRQSPVVVNGLYATCPTCGETYDLSCNATPTKGISKEGLKRYATIYSDKILSIYNR